jgi:hypothetical protein
MMSIDRRRNRSPFTSIALARWLDAVAAKHGLEGVVLADPCGLLVAHGAMDVDRAEAVAAIACLPVTGTEELAIHRFEHDGETLYLCGLGRRRTPTALERAQTGVQRILDERIEA